MTIEYLQPRQMSHPRKHIPRYVLYAVVRQVTVDSFENNFIMTITIDDE